MDIAAAPDRRPREWTVSMQVRLWTVATVRADDLDEAMALAEEQTRDAYGADIFINADSTEVA
jgi:hypothetical protein